MRRASKIGMPLGLAVVAGVTGGLVALGVAHAGQQPRGDNRVVSDISSASPAASTSATASPTTVATTTAGPQPAQAAPTRAGRQAQALETTDPATDPATTAPADDPTTPDVLPTVPVKPSGWDDPIEPIRPVDPVQPPQGD